ncbi:MAG: hypothetical protein ACOVNU_09410 [Candidatus Kapaibacteriota bacterium]
MKQFNSDKKITSNTQNDKLKSIIDKNVKNPNYSQKIEDNSNVVYNFENEYSEKVSEDRVYYNESENELFSDDDLVEKETQFNSNLNNNKKQKLSFRTIFINSDVYIFFKVWLNLNRWGVFIYLILTSATVVYFVYNVMKVNSLLSEIRILNKVKNEMSGKNKILEVKLVEMQSPERINKIATESMGFQKATEAPFYIKNTIQK